MDKGRLYSSVVTGHILHGNQYNRAVEAHEVSLKALGDRWIHQFFNERPLVKEALSIAMRGLAEAFDAKTEKKTW